MSSSRVCSSVAPHVRRLPKLPRTQNTLLTAPTTFRACSSWRRDRSSRKPESQNQRSEEANKKHTNGSTSSSPEEPNSSLYEPSRRERMWQERMEYVRRMTDADPYEALFGRSNRLLRGLGHDWPLEQRNWLDKELRFTVKNPFAQGGKHETIATGQGVEIESQSVTIKEAGKEPKHEAKANVRITTQDGVKEVAFEYDPISNRMVSKDVKALHESGQDANAQVEIPVRPTRQEQPVKPKPSFMMLKEDLPKIAALDISATPTPEQPTRTASAREEYEQYKAKRFASSEAAKKWLEREGFRSGQSLEPRQKLERSFEDIHSIDKEVAEHVNLQRRPWVVQTSQGSKVSTSIKQDYDVAKADKEILEYTRRVVSENLQNKKLAQTPAKAIMTAPSPLPPAPYDIAKADQDVLDYYKQVATDNLKAKQHAKSQEMRAKTETQTKVTAASPPQTPIVMPYDTAKADREVLDYHKQVARDNIKVRRQAKEQKEREDMEAYQKAAPIREAFKKFNEDHSRDQIRNYTRQVVAANLKARQDIELAATKNRSGLADAELERIVDLATKFKKQNPTVSLPPLVDEVLATASKSNEALETSLQRYMDRGADVTRKPALQTSLQRLDTVTTKALTTEKPSENVEQKRTHEPVGYNHKRESKSVKCLTYPPLPKVRRVPSLAEMFGYKKPAEGDSKHSRQEKETERVADMLLREIDAQRDAFAKHEASRTASTPTYSDLTVAQAAEQRAIDDFKNKEEDLRIAHEIQQIFEGAYGPISAQKTQMQQPAPSAIQSAEHVVEAAATRSQGSVDSIASTDLSATPPASAATPTPSTSQQTEVQPSSTLKIPRASPIHKYTIISYDSSSGAMASATFDSIPSAEEKPIPLTVVLNHLTEAAKFVPKLHELRSQGFIPVHAERNLLILRQDERAAVAESPVAEITAKEEVVQNTAEKEGATTGRQPRRVEDVFSGRASGRRGGHWKDAAREAARERMWRRRGRFRRAVRFLATGTAGAAAVVYLAGVGAEITEHRGRRKVIVERGE